MTFYIKVGDVILIRGSAKHSKVIAAATNGPFSHACLVVGESQIIEALGSGGVQYTSSLKFIIKDKANIAVLRPKQLSGDRGDEIRARIEDIAKGYQSKQYNYEDAVKSILNREQPTHENKFFCSQLVSSIFRAAGLPLIIKKDHNVTPNDFYKSTDLFEEITEKSIAILPESQVERLKDVQATPIDCGGDTVSDVAVLLQDFLKGLQKVFSKYGLKSPVDMWNVIDALTDSSNSNFAACLDAEVVNVFDSMGVLSKLTLPDDDRSVDIDALLNEVYEKGLPHIQYQALVTKKTLDHLEKKGIEVQGYLEAYIAAATRLGLTYAARMCDYYTLMMQHSINLQNLLLEKSAILQAFEKAYQDGSNRGDQIEIQVTRGGNVDTLKYEREMLGKGWKRLS